MKVLALLILFLFKASLFLQAQEKSKSAGRINIEKLSAGDNFFRNTDFMVGGKAGKNKNILQYTFYGGLNEVDDVLVLGVKL